MSYKIDPPVFSQSETRIYLCMWISNSYFYIFFFSNISDFLFFNRHSKTSQNRKIDQIASPLSKMKFWNVSSRFNIRIFSSRPFSCKSVLTQTTKGLRTQKRVRNLQNWLGNISKFRENFKSDSNPNLNQNDELKSLVLGFR